MGEGEREREPEFLHRNRHVSIASYTLQQIPRLIYRNKVGHNVVGCVVNFDSCGLLARFPFHSA